MDRIAREKGNAQHRQFVISFYRLFYGVQSLSVPNILPTRWQNASHGLMQWNFLAETAALARGAVAGEGISSPNSEMWSLYHKVRTFFQENPE